MASKKIPKLVMKPRQSTRRLKVPSEMEVSEQEGHESHRSKSLTRATRVIQKARSSFRTHAILIVAGLCAAIVLYGVGTVLTAEPEGPAIQQQDGPGKENKEGEISSIMERVPDSPGIWKKITVTNAGINVEFYREEKFPGGRRLILWKPPKPKPEPSSYEKQKSEPQGSEGLTVH
jgi:hypothetical protein